ncbi:MAG: glycosidase [Leptospira sp.]|nr:glycosidase [Leptospira sp.]
MKRKYTEIFKRHTLNPILTADMWPYPIHSVFNAGATLLPNGNTLLLCRVEERTGKSHFCKAISENGIDSWVIDSKPTLLPDPKIFPEEIWGIEDPRITFVPELKQYIIAYTAYSREGPGVALMKTEDFVVFDRLGLVKQPDDKDSALFPRKINGKWALIHRPIGSDGSHIWLSYAHDLMHWGEERMMLQARHGGWWDANKIGLSPPPIETPEGWLVIYHGVRQNASGSLYRLGLALFDLENPEICLKRGDEWIFGAEEIYEKLGDVDKVVFPCGYTILPDGDTIHLYYGAADTCIALAIGSIKELLKWLDIHK